MYLMALRFALTGGATFVFYNVLLITFVELLHLSLVGGSAAAYLISLLVNYALHYTWTFSAKRRHTETSWKYVVMVATGFFFNFFVMWIAQKKGWNYLLVQNLTLTLIIIWNFLISRFWVFKI